MERWKRFAILVCLVLTGGVLIALYAQFQQLLLHPFAIIGAVLLAVVISFILLRVALVPEQRYVGWARAIGGPNGRWFFLILIIVWCAGMAFLASTYDQNLFDNVRVGPVEVEPKADGSK